MSDEEPDMSNNSADSTISSAESSDESEQSDFEDPVVVEEEDPGEGGSIETQSIQVKTGDFVLANFRGGTDRHPKTYKYVCAVEKIEAEEIHVMGLKSQGPTRTLFQSQVKDISVIFHTDISAVLPEPIVVNFGDRFCFKFPKPIAIQEK